MTRSTSQQGLDRPIWSTFSIFLICTVVEGLLTAADLGWLGSPYWRGTAYGYGAFYTDLVVNWQGNFALQPVTMFLSYSFLHDGPPHLIFNMVALLVFGGLVQRQVGNLRFLIAYLCCTIGGAVFFAVLSSSPAPMVGASGALFGLIGIWICWAYLDRLHYGEGMRDIYRFLIILLLYNLIPWLLLDGRLAWETHLGGFVTGWLIALAWGRQTYQRRDRTSFKKKAARN